MPDRELLIVALWVFTCAYGKRPHYVDEYERHGVGRSMADRVIWKTELGES